MKYVTYQKPFLLNQNCFNASYSYSFYVNNVSVSALSTTLPNGLKIKDTSTFTNFSIYASSLSQQGNFSFRMRMYVTNNNKIFGDTFPVRINISSRNLAAPYFTSSLAFFIMQAYEAVTYEIPDISDLDGDSYSVEYGSLPRFAK